MIPTTIINPPLNSAPPNSAPGHLVHEYPYNHDRRLFTVPIDAGEPLACLQITIPPLPVNLPYYWPLSAWPSHLHLTNVMRTRKYQIQTAHNTSLVPTTHLVPGYFLLSHQSCKKFVSHTQLLLDHKSTSPTDHTPILIIADHPKIMPPKSSKTTRKPPPEGVTAPYPPFGQHPSDPSNTRLDHALKPPPPQLSTIRKIASCSKSAYAPKAKQPPPRGCSAAPTRHSYPIFTNNDASTTTTSSLTLGSASIAPSRRKSPSAIYRPRSLSRPTISSTVQSPPVPSKNQMEVSPPLTAMVPYVKALEARRVSRMAELLAREKAEEDARSHLTSKKCAAKKNGLLIWKPASWS